MVGHGGTAEVLQAEGADGQLVAIKRFRVDVPVEDVANEVKIMKRLSHPNVMAMRDAFFHVRSACPAPCPTVSTH